MTFSNRTPNDLTPNAWAEQAAQGSGALDLTLSNPTECGFHYPPDLLKPLSDPSSLFYSPHPFGSLEAREALAQYLSLKGPTIHPDRLVLTASTSEAYSFLFKLLADPGDAFLYRVPGYPLLEHLARLEGVHLTPCPSLLQADWPLDPALMDQTPPPHCRGLILVNPNNPTGTYLSKQDQGLLGPYLAAHSLAIISDEVFFDFSYPGHAPQPWDPPGCLSFRLGGISKSLGLPQLKLSWIVMEGPEKEVQECRERIEVIADSYLSVNGPVQAALPKLLDWAPDFRTQVLDRVLANRRSLEEALANQDHLRLWPAQGGWYALVEVKNSLENDEALAVELLKKEGVLAHPGGFYDLTGGTFLVLSLLPPESIFTEGIGRMIRFLKKGSR